MKKEDLRTVPTTPHALLAWSQTPLAQAQRATAAALKELNPDAKESLRRARASLVRVVTAPVRFDRKFEDNPSAPLCLVVIERALGRRSLPAVERFVDVAFSQHEGDLVRMADSLLEDLEGLSSDLGFMDSVPLSKYEEQFCRYALEHAEREAHDPFVDACLLAAEYLGDDLEREDDKLAARAFLAWLLQAFPVAYPTFSSAARTRLLLGLLRPSPFVDAAEVQAYLRRVVAGDAVASLDYQVVRTCHLGLIRAFVAEAPQGHGERARALLTELEAHGASRWTPGGQA